MAPPAPDLLVLAASNGENLNLAQRFVAAAEQRQQRADLLDLTRLDLPLFTPRAERQERNPTLIKLEQQLQQAPRWVICAPEYNGSVPPVLSNAIAWLSAQGYDFRALFIGRPIAMATVSGSGGMELLVSLRIQLTHLGAQVVGRQLRSNSAKPPEDASINDLIHRLLQLHPLNL